MNNREMLINAIKGKVINYYIEFCIDCKGKITIMGGEECNAGINFKVSTITENYLWLHPIGKKIVEMEHDQADKVNDADLIREYLKFREQHPNDGWLLETYGNKELRYDRDDLEEVKLELKRRNRQYMKELFGVDLPLDFDFMKDYNERVDNR